MTSAYKSMLHMAEKINQLEFLYNQKLNSLDDNSDDDPIFPLPKFFKQKGLANLYDETMHNIGVFLEILKGETIDEDIYDDYEGELKRVFKYEKLDFEDGDNNTRLEDMIEGDVTELQPFVHQTPKMDHLPRMRFHERIDPYIDWLKSF